MIAVIVIQTTRMEECMKFYSLLGCEFKKEKHGKDGIDHYASIDPKTKVVFEIYPTKNEKAVSKIVLGFDVKANVLNVIPEMNIIQNWSTHQIAIVKDPDERRIMLYKQSDILIDSDSD